MFYLFSSTSQIRSVLVIRADIEAKFFLDWDFLQELSEVLALVGKLTKQLQAETYPPGKFVCDLFNCMLTLRNLANPLALELDKDLKDRSAKITSTIQFKAAAYLDPHLMNPRFKYLNEADQRLAEVCCLIIDFLLFFYFAKLIIFYYLFHRTSCVT